MLKQKAQVGNIPQLNIIVATDIKRVGRGIIKVRGINTRAPWAQTDPLLLWLHQGVYKSFIGFSFRAFFSNLPWDLEVWMSHWSPLDPLICIWLEFRVQPKFNLQNISPCSSTAPKPLSFSWSESSFQFPAPNASTGILHPGVPKPTPSLGGAEISRGFQDLPSHSAIPRYFQQRAVNKDWWNCALRPLKMEGTICSSSEN